MRRSIRSVGLLSPCGWGNLGDAAIQETVIAAIRGRFPDATIVAFTLNPADTARRHGIPARPLSGYSRRSYPIRVAPDNRRLALLVDALLARLQGVRFCYRLGGALREAAAFALREPPHVWLALRTLRKLDVLVISGGGQLDEFWGGPLGHPYVLWKWSLLARLVGTPVVMLSVGVGELRTRASQFFIRGALRRSRYYSVRDVHSRQLLAELKTPGSPCVVPDLAFAAPFGNGGPQPGTPSRRSHELHVGVSPIAYGDPTVWPNPSPATHDRYVRLLGAFLSTLVHGGHRVTLFATDGPDRRTMDRLRDAVGRDCRNLAALDRDDLPGLLDLLGQVDLVVASRLHAILLAHVAGRPVLALSYDWKVARHMTDVGQEAHCVAIDDRLTADAVAAGFQRLVAAAPHVAAALQPVVARCRADVERQFDEVFR